jgi:hypothetical protein
VLDEDRLDLERADLVVARLEDVVGAADEGDVALGVDRRDVTRVVQTAGHRIGVALRITLVTGHERHRPL